MEAMTKTLNELEGDYIDSRDIIERLNELESTEDRDEDETAEIETLRAINAEGETFDDWAYGVTLIPEHRFEDYARELAEDIGAVPDDASWPAYCIDWERAARELLMDYSSIEINGRTYYGR